MRRTFRHTTGANFLGQTIGAIEHAATHHNFHAWQSVHAFDRVNDGANAWRVACRRCEEHQEIWPALMNLSKNFVMRHTAAAKSQFKSSGFKQVRGKLTAQILVLIWSAEQDHALTVTLLTVVPQLQVINHIAQSARCIVERHLLNLILA